MRAAAMWITAQASIIAIDTWMKKHKPPNGRFFIATDGMNMHKPQLANVALLFFAGLPRVALEGIKGSDKVRWLTGYDDAQKTSASSQQRTDTAPKASEQAVPVSQPENDRLAYADDTESKGAKFLKLHRGS